MDAKWLIINADDFGLSAGVNRGIIELYHAGLLKSTTIMTNMPGFQDAVAQALRSPQLGIGLHFNLTYGSPVSPQKGVPTLVDGSGRFSGDYRLWKEREVKTELEAQWERLIQTGILPTHLDSHQHIQRYRLAHRPMVQLALRNQIGMRRLGPKRLAGSLLPRSPDSFILDVYFKFNGLNRLIRHLTFLKPGITELMCHPGYVDQGLLEQCNWTDVRQKELEVLKNPLVKMTIDREGIQLIHYGQILYTF